MMTHSPLLAAVAVLLAWPGVPATGTADQVNAIDELADASAVISIDARSDRGAASQHLLGVNHHYNQNGYGLWIGATDSPAPKAIDGARRAGIDSLRFPGGTIANLYDWKRAVGPERRCQVDGRDSWSTGFDSIHSGLAFGPDEYMEVLAAIDANPMIMIPYVTESPGHAADWVEYMNSPSGTPGNPNGGIDWADVRAANGHPAAYHVARWEIGNEQHHSASRYWMSNDDDKAVRQYAFGGYRDVKGEPLGKACRHPLGGVPSNGSADQKFEILYPPVNESTVVVTVNGSTWRRVNDLSSVGADAHAYSLAPVQGVVTFGDGTHGAVPPDGSVVRASYRSTHAGFFAFARAMKDVDPTINVCASWGQPAFPELVGERDYDCLTAHSITSFEASGDANWANALEGHDYQMLWADRRKSGVERLQDVMPRGTPLWLTEFSAINGDTDAYPAWPTSASHAVYMATQWGNWMELGIPRGLGDDFLWGFDRTVLGPAPDYTFTADAVTRQAIGPMFSAGGKVLSVSTTGNPVRDPDLDGTYRGLAVTATRGPGGTVYLMVVNRLPFAEVPARINLSGVQTTGQATVREVTSNSFTAWNRPGEDPAVTLGVHQKTVGDTGFTHTFPATSTTLIVLPVR